MIDIAYFGFLVFVIYSVIKHKKVMLEYGASSQRYSLLLVSLFLFFPYWFLPMILPQLFYPIPFAVAFYIPTILISRKLTLKYETSGTSLSNEAEKTSSYSTWVGIAGIIKTTILWVLTFATSRI